MTKQITNKEFAQSMATSAASLLTVAAETAERNRAAKKLGEDAPRRDLLGESGMKAECHAKANAKLAGMSAAALKVFRTLPLTVEQMSKAPDAGGLSREAKAFVLTICESVGQKKHPNHVDFSHVAAEAKKIDPKFPAMRSGHKSITHLITMLKARTEWTVDQWAEAYNGETQAKYVIKFLRDMKAGERSGSKGRTMIKVNPENTMIAGLKAL